MHAFHRFALGNTQRSLSVPQFLTFAALFWSYELKEYSHS